MESPIIVFFCFVLLGVIGIVLIDAGMALRRKIRKQGHAPESNAHEIHFYISAMPPPVFYGYDSGSGESQSGKIIIENLPSEILKSALRRAEMVEDFEQAIKIRDELKRRERPIEEDESEFEKWKSPGLAEAYFCLPVPLQSGHFIFAGSFSATGTKFISPTIVTQPVPRQRGQGRSRRVFGMGFVAFFMMLDFKKRLESVRLMKSCRIPIQPPPAELCGKLRGYPSISCTLQSHFNDWINSLSGEQSVVTIEYSGQP